MTTYTITAGLLQELISNCMASIAEDGISDARRVYRTELHHRAKLAMSNLQPNTQEHRADTVFGGPKAREQMLNQLVHPAPKDSDEPRLSDLFCGVDVTDGKLSVSVLRRRFDDVAEVLHSEQLELPQAKPLTDKQIESVCVDVHLKRNFVTNLEKFVAIARAIEAAHNIGVKP